MESQPVGIAPGRPADAVELRLYQRPDGGLVRGILRRWDGLSPVRIGSGAPLPFRRPAPGGRAWNVATSHAWLGRTVHARDAPHVARGNVDVAGNAHPAMPPSRNGWKRGVREEKPGFGHDVADRSVSGYARAMAHTNAIEVFRAMLRRARGGPVQEIRLRNERRAAFHSQPNPAHTASTARIPGTTRVSARVRCDRRGFSPIGRRGVRNRSPWVTTRACSSNTRTILSTGSRAFAAQPGAPMVVSNHRPRVWARVSDPVRARACPTSSSCRSHRIVSAPEKATARSASNTIAASAANHIHPFIPGRLRQRPERSGRKRSRCPPRAPGPEWRRSTGRPGSGRSREGAGASLPLRSERADDIGLLEDPRGLGAVRPVEPALDAVAGEPGLPCRRRHRRREARRGRQ